MGWYIVYVGDEERHFGPLSPDSQEDERVEEHAYVKAPRGAGLRGFFARRVKGHGGD